MADGLLLAAAAPPNADAHWSVVLETGGGGVWPGLMLGKLVNFCPCHAPVIALPQSIAPRTEKKNFAVVRGQPPAARPLKRPVSLPPILNGTSVRWKVLPWSSERKIAALPRP